MGTISTLSQSLLRVSRVTGSVASASGHPALLRNGSPQVGLGLRKPQWDRASRVGCLKAFCCYVIILNYAAQQAIVAWIRQKKELLLAVRM